MRMQLQNHRSNPSSAISGMPYNVNGVQHQLTEHQVYSMNAAMAQERKNLFQELHQLNHKVDQERDRGQYEFSSPHSTFKKSKVSRTEQKSIHSKSREAECIAKSLQKQFPLIKLEQSLLVNGCMNSCPVHGGSHGNANSAQKPKSHE
jgi:hypothetical protein